MGKSGGFLRCLESLVAMKGLQPNYDGAIVRNVDQGYYKLVEGSVIKANIAQVLDGSIRIVFWPTYEECKKLKGIMQVDLFKEKANVDG